MVGIYETPLGIVLAYGLPRGSQMLIKAHTFQPAADLNAKQAVLNQSESQWNCDCN